MKAVLKNYRQSPRKVRLIADLIRGKKVIDALAALKFADKKAAGPFAKVIQSAVANAAREGKKPEALVIKTVAVNKGEVYQRYMPRARGSASPINRRNSHITVELGEK
ncbi:50S ribosomal protein L22 [Candidatus Parcubacteria bacterium]|uniref:Large ribosomal subunit protein uL22 n=1 Tax=Candidatus Kaiserbacteria bacterium CG10_big_fil_rev_8_21_14_0_10_47_16 TaxID=1974608 RepID=A0A2H0UFS8_9BACT|nr:50S ribosomal protein L22 [Candidatus Parcubacteria bacterium]PIR84536.1 MAG: 50S ribosomal protein L22 [Candidatus Kaiserbacteria bacterium CG10_big_fil_rev_8_21_14_0_10_47_16]